VVVIALWMNLGIAGTVVHNVQADFVGATDGTLVTEDGRVIVDFRDRSPWESSDVGGHYLMLRKDAGSAFTGNDCAAPFGASTTTLASVPYRTGPLTADGLMAGIPGGVDLDVPDDLVGGFETHWVHTGGRCTRSDPHRAVSSTTAIESRTVGYTNPWDCTAPTGGSGRLLDSNARSVRYENQSCCKAVVLDARVRAGTLAPTVCAWTTGADAGDEYPGQIWAVTLEISETDFDAFHGPRSGTYTSPVLDAGTGGVWQQASATGPAAGGGVVGARDPRRWAPTSPTTPGPVG
jgi:hypothetical protein